MPDASQELIQTADEVTGLTPVQKQLVRDTFAAVEPIADDAAAMFYDHLFELDPKLRKLFKHDMKEQGRKLMSAIKLTVSSLDNLADLVPAVEKMGVRHAEEYGVKPKHYETVGEALLWTLEQGLKDKFTPETRDAWAQLYGVVSEVMKNGAANGAQAADEPKDSDAASNETASKSREDDMLQKSPPESKMYQDMVDDMPINVMTCDREDFRINYVNKASKRTLKEIEHLLPITADEVIGQSIDIFHKNPQHQRKLLADPKNLPHKAIITVGDEKLDLLVTAIYDDDGEYIGPMVTWSVVTQKLRKDEENERLLAIIEAVGRTQAMIEFELDGTIVTANDNFLETMGYSLDEIVGNHHSMFADPEFARSPEYKQFWADLRAGHFKAGEYPRVNKAGEQIWLQASYNPILNSEGKAIKVVKYAVDITAQKQEKMKADAEAQRLTQMVEDMPINVMLMDPSDFTITYVNQTSKDTLRPLEKLLPCRVDELVGQCVDIFHKHPQHQRALLADPKNLPHKAKIKVGDEVLDLNVSAVMDADDNYISTMLTWNLVTKQVEFAANVRSVVETVAASSTELQATAEAMTSTAEQTSAQASTVASASEQLTASISNRRSAPEWGTAVMPCSHWVPNTGRWRLCRCVPV